MPSEETSPTAYKGMILLLALNWLEYMTQMEDVGGGGHPPFFHHAPASNPWGFVTEDEDITDVLIRGFDLPPEDPREVSCGVYTDRMDVYYKRWAHFHTFLKMNIEVLGETVLDISAFLKDADDLEEETLDQDAERELSPDERFLYFLDSLTSGEITEQDLLAEPDPED